MNLPLRLGLMNRAAAPVVGGGGSFTTLDPSNKGPTTSLTGGNLIMAGTSGQAFARSLVSKSTGQWHWEVTLTTMAHNGWQIGVCNSAHPISGGNEWLGSDTNSVGITLNSDVVYAGTTGSPTSPSFSLAQGDTVAVELDAGAGLLYFQKVGGTRTAALDLVSTFPVGGPWFAAIELDSTPNNSFAVNFGATTFLQTPTSGFVGLS